MKMKKYSNTTKTESLNHKTKSSHNKRFQHQNQPRSKENLSHQDNHH